MRFIRPVIIALSFALLVTLTPAPAQAKARWRPVASADFNRPLGDLWARYNGASGAHPTTTWWDPDHLRARNGRLQVLGYRDRSARFPRRFTTGGVMWRASIPAYARVTARLRCAPNPAGRRIVKCGIGLWPASGRWPRDGEVNIAEEFGRVKRNCWTSTWHYADQRGQHRQLGPRWKCWKRNRVTRWMTVSVDLRPGVARFYQDGHLVVTRRHPTMLNRRVGWRLFIQSEAVTRWRIPRRAKHVMEVDWVRVDRLRR